MSERTIMVIDDSRVSRMMTQAIIEELEPDWIVLEAGSADEALQAVVESHVDYFSVDLNMPGMNGLELITQLRAHYPQAKYTLLTANGQKSIESRASALGVACIQKPVTDASVTALLRTFTG
ncbi:MAG: response regulator [Pseudomonadales bacterium]|nr:response regulator [Pseudomonadales bacterium]